MCEAAEFNSLPVKKRENVPALVAFCRVPEDDDETNYKRKHTTFSCRDLIQVVC